MARLAAVQRMVGLTDPGPPIQVLVLPEDSDAASDAPAWVAGYADGTAGLIVLFPERSLPYPHRDFEGLVTHEVAHVLIDRAAGGRSVPRWFHEGIATAAGEWGAGDRMRVAVAMLFGGDLSLAAVEEAFTSGDARRVGRAYALAGEFVRELLAREGPRAAARVLAARAAGESFEQAFASGTGATLALAETVFWDRGSRALRWLQVLASSTVLWAAIVMLSGWAFWRRRRSAAAIRRRWAEEERSREPVLPLDREED